MGESGKRYAGRLIPYVWVLLSVLIATAIAMILHSFFDPVNMAFLFLLPVLFSAVLWGRGPSFFASFVGVLMFDFFFVPPVLSFTVSDVRYLFSFAVFLLVALVTGTMATKLRDEAEKARQREKRTLALYELSRKIAAETDLEKVSNMVIEKVAETINGEVVMLIHDPDADALVEMAASPSNSTLPDEKERALAHWVLEHGQSAGRGTEIVSEARGSFFPVKAEDKTLAVLAIKLHEEETVLFEQQQLIEAFTNLAAVAITRVRLAKEAEQARWLAESEKLHRALLNSISHDLRTPLSSITGAVTGLLTEGGVYDEEARNILLGTIDEEAQRMNRFVANLLDMTRIESGMLKLNKEWCDIQDIIGVALREMKDMLRDHPLHVDVPPDLPLVMGDFALLEHVIINLLENGVKYSPPNGEISLSARLSGQMLSVTVADRGPAISVPDGKRIFDKFHRLDSARHISGTGLGLSICKGIIEAHEGTIGVDSVQGHGNRFTFFLPIPEQPLEQPDAGKG